MDKVSWVHWISNHLSPLCKAQQPDAGLHYFISCFLVSSSSMNSIHIQQSVLLYASVLIYTHQKTKPAVFSSVHYICYLLCPIFLPTHLHFVSYMHINLAHPTEHACSLHFFQVFLSPLHSSLMFHFHEALEKERAREKNEWESSERKCQILTSGIVALYRWLWKTGGLSFSSIISNKQEWSPEPSWVKKTDTQIWFHLYIFCLLHTIISCTQLTSHSPILSYWPCVTISLLSTSPWPVFHPHINTILVGIYLFASCLMIVFK